MHVLYCYIGVLLFYIAQGTNINNPIENTIDAWVQYIISVYDIIIKLQMEAVEHACIEMHWEMGGSYGKIWFNYQGTIFYISEVEEKHARSQLRLLLGKVLVIAPKHFTPNFITALQVRHLTHLYYQYSQS
jgi:hypothetical protein